jgi:hypothetical protein
MLRRDVETLNRLRAALKLDSSLDAAKVAESCQLIDSLTDKLLVMIHSRPTTP